MRKKTSKNSTLDDIKDPNGTEFANETERNNYVTNFYSSLYRKDETVEGKIEDFLRPDNCAHPVVTGSKLTDAEHAQLDPPLRIEELDVALNKANVKSAPGVGISYRLCGFMDWYMTESHYSLGMVTRTWSTLYLQRRFLIYTILHCAYSCNVCSSPITPA